MAEEQKNPVAKTDGVRVYANADQAQAQQRISDAELAAGMAMGSDVASMQQARDAAAAAGATNAVANLDAAIAAAPQQAVTSNIPSVINAAVEKGIITSAQAEQINQMAAGQTVASSVASAVQVKQSFTSNVQAPEATFTAQVEADKAAASKAAGRSAA
ncbi:MAG: hypothetical protein SFW63_08090 [Alphaproteobacteria bacterium]|nr:hypothetical protein [Alphaproteobacteria bacterium]